APSRTGSRRAPSAPPTPPSSSGPASFRSTTRAPPTATGSRVGDEGLDRAGAEPLAPLEEAELDDEQAGGHLAAPHLDQVGRRRRGAAGRDEIVHHHVAAPRLDGIDVH